MTNQEDRLQPAAASKRKSFRTCLHHVWRHLKAAIFVASCVVILDGYDWLEDLKIDTLQLALPLLLQTDPEFPETYNNEFGSTKVITINDKLYETKFKQSSPLDRYELHNIFEQILENKPKVLAVDLDLSPGPEGSTEGETELYNLLKQAKGTEIVLITPDKVYSDDLINRKVQWMKEMCVYEHIHFGFPYLYSINGVVFKHLRDSDSFANQIYQAAVKQGFSTNKSRKSDSPNTICEDKQFNCFVSAKAPADISPESKLLNYKFLDYIEPFRIAGNLKVNTNKLKEQVVLLGGSYGSTDKYETPVGALAGVYIHAASYYSRVNPVEDLSHVLTYLVEIVVSTVLGVTFYSLARWYRKTHSLLSIVSNLGLQLPLMYIFILIAGYFLRFNLWINPAPLIIGMEIHALLASVEEPYINGTNKLLGIPEIIIKRVFYCGIIFTAWFFIAEEFIKH